MRVEGNEKREEKKEEGVEGTESPVERESSPPVKTSPESEKKKDEDEGEEIEKREEERLVTIMGTDNQIYKAQYAIFAKIAEQQQLYLEEVSTVYMSSERSTVESGNCY